ncbi:MAG: ABC transporter ATP-binding protein [Saprospiraceae bacterium]|jgi:lipoprotein-releasing system ATP-binding protein|uniref:ABC transporter ATP-binding protein n=1 Tax=Candidatus Brachybacter algidus TaxID=2982024 RepID=UPI001B55D7FA|nr:ABC transporter ATP-binding protein [Candidatus Brachybacter algidus]MBP7306323.1 ABC transporter ATP-binding protein [Saprospiraceae bacterium]MBK6449067.1 ABC transporter ATP-binding protein [Candidatus Brachybacter algidus]MBK7602034.1 ABC transporter ATP-binding protein [Candidatus Brachybacter algidus]MBK8843437.1 ABC transporter ATP-binding protein [Candidatus Brachybacter algidus]MBK9398712.1 ABC transporter ATP-binding protein [Candidatus Brachybacter algidus]
MSNEIVLGAKSINKSFFNPVKVEVLKDVSFSLSRGEYVSIIGRSGSGKSTLLYILSTMDTDFEGELLLDGISIHNKSEKQLAAIRNEKIGFVFQFHYLLNEFTTLKNVMLPGFKLDKVNEEELETNAYEFLKDLGIEKLANKMAYQLSGGEKQRVAIARAMINDPLIIMCDEPTGNLDSKNADIVFNIFKELTETYNKTLLVVTHDMSFAEKTGRIIELDDGRIIRG